MIISKGNPQPFPELRGKLGHMRYPAYVEPKIDGELNWFKVIKGEPYLINKSGKMRSDFPAVIELDEMLENDSNLLGELHWGDGKSGDLYEFLKHQKDDELQFTVFDVDMPGTYEERRVWLENNIKKAKHVDLVKKSKCLAKDWISLWYTDYITEGYEGIVVKPADSRLVMGPCSWVKMKHRETLDCMVENISTTQDRIEVRTKLNKAGAICGVKCTKASKSTLRAGDIVEIEHQGILSGGGLRHPVFIRKKGDV